jgi:hypothetical protein
MGVALRLISQALCLVLLAGCGGDKEERSAGDEPPVGDETVEEVEVGQGTLFADPEAIRQYTAPAAQISTDADLVAYLLPGLTGSGAHCLEDELDADQILESSIADGAVVVVERILACVAPEQIGKIFGMYAVGFEKDGPSRYAGLAECVIDGFSRLDRADVEEALTEVYTERLDLAGPPTSRLVAAEKIDDLTGCSTSAPPTPEGSDQIPHDPDPSPQNQRVIKWELLQPGDCLVDLPSARVLQVTVVDCSVPHRLEVVGAAFSGSPDDADSQCANLYANYTGRNLDEAEHRIEYLQGEPGSLSARLICLATAADGRPRAGSLR